MAKQRKKAESPKNRKKDISKPKKSEPVSKKGFSTKQSKSSKISSTKEKGDHSQQKQSDRNVLPSLAQLLEDNSWKLIEYPVIISRRVTDKNRTVLKEQQTLFKHLGRATQPVEFFDFLWGSIESYIIRSNLDLDIFQNHKRSYKTQFTKSMLRKFLGTCIVQGVSGVTATEMLFDKEGLCVNFPGKEYQLPQEAFGKLSNNLNFDLNEVHRLLVHNFKFHIAPGHFLTIDESRIPETRFASELKTFNAKKPSKWAVESKTLNDQTKYLIDFINPLKEPKPTPGEAAHSFFQFLKSQESFHHVFLDSNFFNLADVALVSHNNPFIKVTASVRADRPTFLFKEGLAKELPVTYTRVAQLQDDQKIIAASTHNRKVISLITTGFEVHNIDDGEVNASDRRLPLQTYDKHKGYTDKFDQLVASYYITHRWKSDKMNLLMGWFQFALTNAYIIYKNTIEEPVNHKNFRLLVAEEFLKSEELIFHEKSTKKRKINSLQRG
jgi:hypothetical protein